MGTEQSEASEGGADCRVGKAEAELYEIAARQGKKHMKIWHMKIIGSSEAKKKKKIRNTHSMNVNNVVVVSMMMRVGDQLLVLPG